MKGYQTFLAKKRIEDRATGLNRAPKLNAKLFDFQRDIVGWALRRGRAAIFADCGMGKTAMQLEWAVHVPGRTLIVAPLAVGAQTVRESSKFGIPGVKYMRQDDGETRIAVTNYEMLDRFCPDDFHGLVLDESSILKSYAGKFRNQLIDDWTSVPFRMAATATPAPNDFMELGNHAEFIGAMTRTEMLSHFFVHDSGETQQWRLKGHAEEEFWRWMCSWAVMLRKPSDLGYEDGGFILPALHINQVTVEASHEDAGFLFPMQASTLSERQDARRASVEQRVAAVADMANGSREQWLIWCDLNAESSALASSIDGAVEVRGSDTIDEKESRLRGFSDGEIRVLVTKPSIAGHGMNWQCCSHMAFTGLSDSYEQFYQAVRRCWRFGQKREVNAYIVTASTEGAVVANIKRKETDAARMADMMVAHMHDLNAENIRGTERNISHYTANTKMQIPAFL